MHLQVTVTSRDVKDMELGTHLCSPAMAAAAAIAGKFVDVRDMPEVQA